MYLKGLMAAQLIRQHTAWLRYASTEWIVFVVVTFKLDISAVCSGTRSLDIRVIANLKQSHRQ